ncbi:PBSX family phage terminase large subunit [Arenibaculum pallidiluteum]|uniref:PBSX family phage terminase large subunit n=1 Tax=Arenibaculum pallidiluteum TaxID=2812559 RepID=UPI001A970EBF|nr:PBSX family phage terminase large subunit [Arenibaculum pallidiluteum]
MRAEFPAKLRCLFEPARYKVLYGGRGAAKSWGIARALLIQGTARPLRVLCAREIQRSMRDSVHRLLADQVRALGLSRFYTVLSDTIRGANGTEFLFAGLRHNVDSIKSKEGIDIAWVEEAQAVTKSSWDTLIPTIRKEGSEIWVSFNPALAEDETYRRFVLAPPAGAVVVKVNWSDNPWFPEVLRREMEDLRMRDRDAWLNVWEGHCRQTVDGAVYAAELRQAAEEGRLGRVPHDASMHVHCFWDLGWSDCVSVWMAQTVGLEFRILDFLQASQRPIAWYVAELQRRPYVWGVDWLPHDARAELLAASGRTIESQMRELGRTVQIVPRISVADGINAARTVFPRCWFDEARCAEGLQALRHYRYEVDPDTGRFGRNPLHDQASHAADAFRYLALVLAEAGLAPRRGADRPAGAGGWMG